MKTGKWEKLKSNYKALYTLLCRIKLMYGGGGALLLSPLFHLSLAITILLAPYWIQPFWWDLVISVIPNLLGFTLGGYAILLAFGNEKFQKLIVGKLENETCSPFMEISASFFHFITMQILALLISILVKGFYIEIPLTIKSILFWLNIPPDLYIRITRWIGWGIGFFLFIYSLTLALASAMSIFTITEMFDIFHSNDKKNINESIKNN